MATELDEVTAQENRPKTAVLYLRVSTPRQMDTAINIDPEGNSIATQREATLARVAKLGVEVVAEFVEPGNSAQSIEKRPIFRELLTYLRDAKPAVDYVVVYMRSRAFRNYIDAGITKRQLQLMGTKLISVKEDFGEGIWADAMEGITDILNEVEVRRNGEDIRAKMRHKVEQGGHNGKAKLGYTNIRAEQDGRLYNSIGIDTQRAPLVRHAFELYATGGYTTDLLVTTMQDLGLTLRPTRRWPQERGISDTHLARILQDPYYAGWVSLDGRLIPGRHEAIISQDLFDRAQLVYDLRSRRGQRDRVLQHYLKGILFCDRCHQVGRTSRLIYTEARGRNSNLYSYFLCRARQEGTCDLPYLPAHEVEEAICLHYQLMTLPDGFAELIERDLTETMAERQTLTTQMNAQLKDQLIRLNAREERLLDLIADGLLDRNKIHERTNALQQERIQIQATLGNTQNELDIGAANLRATIELARDPRQLYQLAPESVRRQLNHTFFRKLFLDEDHGTITTRDTPTEPFEEIRDAANAYTLSHSERTSVTTKRSSVAAKTSIETRPYRLADIFRVNVSSKTVLVELRGFEPLTPCMPCRCATSCATAPNTSFLTRVRPYRTPAVDMESTKQRKI